MLFFVLVLLRRVHRRGSAIEKGNTNSEEFPKTKQNNTILSGFFHGIRTEYNFNLAKNEVSMCHPKFSATAY